MSENIFLPSRHYNVASLLALFLFLFLGPSLAWAQTSNPHLSLSPTVKEVAPQVSFNTTVSIDTGGELTSGVDAIIEYNSSILEVVSVSEGTFYPTITTLNNTVGKVEIYGIADSASPKSGTGTLATITFRGKATGTATVNFLCQTGGTSDSNINSTDNEDIIVCADNINASYIIESSQEEATTTATPTATTSQELPQTGFLEPTALIIGGGIILIILGLAFIF
jgi:hypothetical protein